LAEDPGDNSIDAPAGAGEKTKGEDFGTIELMIPGKKDDETIAAAKTLTISEVG
jgi:hypothetical protein